MRRRPDLRRGGKGGCGDLDEGREGEQEPDHRAIIAFPATLANPLRPARFAETKRGVEK